MYVVDITDNACHFEEDLINPQKCDKYTRVFMEYKYL